MIVFGCAAGAPVASPAPSAAPPTASAASTPVDSADAAPSASASAAPAAPRPSCGDELGRAWAKVPYEGDPASTTVKLLAAFATACASAAPRLAAGARAAAVANVDARTRALAEAAYTELDPICRFASTEPMAEHPALPRCLTKHDRPSVAAAQPYFQGNDPGILCDVNVGTYLFLVAAEPYLGSEPHLLSRLMLAAAHEGDSLKRVCWAHRR